MPLSLEARRERGRHHDVEDLHRAGSPLTGRAQGADPDQPLHEPQGRCGEQDGPRGGELFHACRQVGRLPDGRVIHVQVIADGADHHLAGVESDADLHLHTMRAAHLRAVVAHGLLHGERRIAGAYRMVLMGQGRPEQGHDAIAHDLVDGALVAVHGGHHALQHGVEQLPRLLGIAIGQQFHGPLHVGKEHGHLLAFAFQRTAGGEDFFSAR